MAERRMFAKTIIDSDMFLDMPLSTQALYFHLSMRADDEGFINNPKKIMRMIGATQNELEILLAKRFILSFSSGVIVIKHWKMHNYIQSDRRKPTVYHEEAAQLITKENKAYTFAYQQDIPCIQDGYNLDTQDSIGKVSIDKDSIGKDIETGEEKPVKCDLPDEAIECAEYFYEQLMIYAKPPTMKNRKPNTTSWAKDIEKLHRLGGIEYQDIYFVIDNVVKDDFWCKNVLSGKKLREHYDKLYLEYTKPGKNNKQKDMASQMKLDAERNEQMRIQEGW